MRHKKTGHTKGITSIAYSHPTKLIISGGYGKEVMLWNPVSASPGPVHSFEGHDKRLLGVWSDYVGPTAMSVDVTGK
eukprot:gene20413-7415_t